MRLEVPIGGPRSRGVIDGLGGGEKVLRAVGEVATNTGPQFRRRIGPDPFPTVRPSVPDRDPVGVTSPAAALRRFCVLQQRTVYLS